ncbi:MAG: HDIG domain-containing protein [Treponema sp.]|nr:HDIG domain-containing protein [Treponema sp.]
MKREWRKALLDKLLPLPENRGPALAWAGAFFICLVAVLTNVNSTLGFGRNFDEFVVGRVAERDVVANHSITYVDEQATRLLVEAQERLVPAVFHFSSRGTEELQNRWNHFAVLAENQFEQQSLQTFIQTINSEFPGEFTNEFLTILYQSPERIEILRNATTVIAAILQTGVYSIPETGLDRYNSEVLELIRQSGTRIEQERVPLSGITTLDNIANVLTSHVAEGRYPIVLVRSVYQLLGPFISPNVFYSPEDTALRVIEARTRVDPVMRHIDQGRHIIKRGFVITEEDMTELLALRMNLPRNDLSSVFSNMLFLLLLFALLYYFSGSRIIGRKLLNNETYLVCCLSALYIAGSILVRNISIEHMPVAIVFPTALVIILPSILIHPRLALLLAMALPLGAFLTGSFDAPSFVFATVSGVVAAYSLQGAEKRMDLVKAGLVIAAANIAAITAVLLWQRIGFSTYPAAIFWAAFNGIASGMLVLGLLPPLEHALNAATSFRLIELSDLNAPILRRLFTVAPGTYSHSIMVANLAEAACQEIGANPLLARVGAYYHDLGKMENPECFVENQADYNCHDDMAPRLSATVIRSHVKLGVEKARQLGLPRELIEIIGEHHGNSVITWFYNKALEQEDAKKSAVSMDDFTYPGNTPRSRESAVVMLADVTEAAVRTLDKPTAVKIEKFTQELIANKVETGQLAKSELTFRDLETIKNSFVRALAGYYHSRIEYPKLATKKEAVKK